MAFGVYVRYRFLDARDELRFMGLGPVPRRPDEGSKA